ncbi:MAG TPA: inositol monophosphatase family protein [Chroococcales cyanobacterium]
MKSVSSVRAASSLSAEDISFVGDLCVEAGILAKEMREGVDIQEKSGPYDKVTAADYALSKLLVEKISQRFPNDTVVSEEDEKHSSSERSSRVWLIDPIDGTDNYISNDGQYSIMIGLLEDLKPTFGWVFAPATMTLYFGGPTYGAWRKSEGRESEQFGQLPDLTNESRARLVMGFRDRKAHPWVREHPKIELIKAGSIGLKVAKVLEDQADVFAHLSAALKTWDTAGPAAIALGGGLDVGSIDSDTLVFPGSTIKHAVSVIIGRPGALKWSRVQLTPYMGEGSA